MGRNQLAEMNRQEGYKLISFKSARHTGGRLAESAFSLYIRRSCISLRTLLNLQNNLQQQKFYFQNLSRNRIKQDYYEVKTLKFELDIEFQ